MNPNSDCLNQTNFHFKTIRIQQFCQGRRNQKKSTDLPINRETIKKQKKILLSFKTIFVSKRTQDPSRKPFFKNPEKSPPLTFENCQKKKKKSSPLILIDTTQSLKETPKKNKCFDALPKNQMNQGPSRDRKSLFPFCQTKSYSLLSLLLPQISGKIFPSPKKNPLTTCCSWVFIPFQLNTQIFINGRDPTSQDSSLPSLESAHKSSLYPCVRVCICEYVCEYCQNEKNATLSAKKSDSICAWGWFFCNFGVCRGFLLPKEVLSSTWVSEIRTSCGLVAWTRGLGFETSMRVWGSF